MDLIDTSPIALGIGIVICIITILITKYLLEKKLTDENKLDNTQVIGYSILAGIILGMLSLIIYKQFILYKSNNEILTDNFYKN